MFSRRDILAATAVGGVATAAAMTSTNAAPVKSDITFGNPDDPPQGAINAKNVRRKEGGGGPERRKAGARRMTEGRRRPA